ncbi:hypothetical protein BFJ63_vAg18060 [Fusarium oxysporum f. sp. narcissi]|uniref:Uncharacterized protein n=1 Tax=Fusarium oxysporum f. sp. narcissi TaxID=451672 RepID=A0A4Q2V424_FUSOX|nr:hypothetical protein BFJ63_vAg18060 [Fusarium oxysporum f. sp. narcissi]
MRTSLNHQMCRDRETAANATDSAIIDFMKAAVINSTTLGSASPFSHYGVSRTPYRDISTRSMALSFHIATGESLWPSDPIDDAVVSEYCTENLCIHLYAFEKENGSHPVDDSFSLLIKDAIGSVDEAARKRIPRLWYDVYSKPERIQALKITTAHAIARPKRRDEPGFNPEEAELAMGIRQDDVLAFKDAHKSGRLLGDIDPTTESGVNALFMLMIELHLKNILCFCLEEGLVDIEASINGFTPLQWSVKKGTWTAAATLLDLGANVSVLFHNTFVEEVITFGSQRSINILYFVQAVASSFPHICHIGESVEHVKDFDFNEKRFKTRPTDREPSSSAIHLAIFENAWTSFAALLSLGADVEKPCCKSMNPLQWAVGLLRPIFVGALIDAGASPNVRTTDSLETPLHELVQLDTTQWPNRWIYGDSQALRAPDDTRRDDQTHADIILELLLRAPTIDKEVRNDKGATPFLAACSAGNVRMCRRLASAEANPLATMPDGRGALHLAVEATDSGLVDYLCREWPEMMKMEDCEHRTPLSAAVDSSASEILAVWLLPPPVTPCAEVSESSAFRILGTAQQDFGALEILFGHYEAADPGSVIKALNGRDVGKNVSGPQSRDIQVKGLKSPKANIVETCATPPVAATSTAPNIEARHCGRSDSSVSAYVTTGASTETTSLLSSLDGYRIRQCITASSALFLNPCTGLASRIIQDEITQRI